MIIRQKYARYKNLVFDRNSRLTLNKFKIYLQQLTNKFFDEDWQILPRVDPNIRDSLHTGRRRIA